MLEIGDESAYAEEVEGESDEVEGKETELEVVDSKIEELLGEDVILVLDEEVDTVEVTADSGVLVGREESGELELGAAIRTIRVFRTRSGFEGGGTVC